MTLSRGHGTNTAMVALDQRLQDMGRIVANADRTPRTGVMGNAAGTSIVATTAATGPMTVTVAAAEFVCSKGIADGVTLPTNDGSVSVTINAAPGSNSRITVIWVKQQDNTTGDGASTPTFGTTDGTAAASPTKPAIPTGALELATLRVYAGTTASNGGSNLLTNTYQMTATRGGVVPVRSITERDAWTAPAPVEGQLVFELTGRTLYRYANGAWTSDERLIVPTSVTGTGASIVAGDIILTSATGDINFAIPFSTRYDHYLIEISCDACSADAGTTFRLRSGGSPLSGAVYYGTQTEQAISVGPTKNDVNAATDFPAGRVAVGGGQINIDIFRPLKTVGDKAFFVRSQDGSAYYRHGGGKYNTTATLDGLVFRIGAITVTSGRIRIVGVA